jgi:glutamate racemase
MPHKNNFPNTKGTIGVFDSGLGGLWVLKHLVEALPNYHYIYYADQAHVPYGAQSPADIVAFSSTITEFLLDKGCALIVVACNTATSSGIAHLRATYDTPFIGMEPAIKPATALSKTRHIGVLATKITAEGAKLHETIDQTAHGVEVHIAIGNGLVELVEAGKADTDEAEALLRTHLAPLLKNNIDQLVLGCTHYAFLIPRLQKILGDTVHIVDPSPAVVRRVEEMLGDAGILATETSGSVDLFTSGKDLEKMKRFYQQIEL